MIIVSAPNTMNKADTLIRPKCDEASQGTFTVEQRDANLKACEDADTDICAEHANISIIDL